MVLRVEPPHAVNVDSLAFSMPSCRRDVDYLAGGPAQTPQRGCVTMTQNGALPTGQNRRHEPSFWGEHRVTDGIHASVNRVKPTHRYAPLDRRRREAELQQLVVRDDPVLPGG